MRHFFFFSFYLKRALFFGVLFFPIVVFANTFYAAPNGQPHASGTRQDPLPLVEAIAQSQSGDKVILKNGVYSLSDTIVIDKSLILTGDAQQAVLNFTLRSNDPVFLIKASAQDSVNLSYLNIFDVSVVGPPQTRSIIKIQGGQFELSHSKLSSLAQAYGIEATDIVADAQVEVIDSEFNDLGVSIWVGDSYLKRVKNSVFNNSTNNHIFYSPSLGGNTLAIANRHETSIVENHFNDLAYMHATALIFMTGNNINAVISQNIFRDLTGTSRGIEISTLDKRVKIEVSKNQFEVDKAVVLLSEEAGFLEGDVFNNYIKNGSYGFYAESIGSVRNPVRFYNNLITGTETSLYFGQNSGANQSGAVELCHNTIHAGAFLRSNSIWIRQKMRASVQNNIVYFDTQATNFGITVKNRRSTNVHLGGNNVYGFEENYNINSSPLHVDMGQNVSIQPPFVSSTDYDLTAAVPASPGLCSYVNQDIEGNQRGNQPDAGAFQH